MTTRASLALDRVTGDGRVAQDQETQGAAPLTPAAPDVAGRDRMVGNVLASWAGYSVFVIAGFVMPRLFDRYLGQTLLGVWDFCWSFVGYFGLIQFAIGASVNRFVARHRSRGATEDLCGTVSSALAIQNVLALIVVAATVVVCWVLPKTFDSLGPDAGTATWVLAMLGGGLAVQFATDTYRGVITGCHRWGLHNGLNSGFYAVSIVGMIGVLVTGGTLVGVAAVYTAGVVLTEVVRVFAAYRVCPELRISWSSISVARMRELVGFGSKQALDDTATIVLTQTNALAITALLGPAALALFSRSQALCRQIDTILNKFAYILTPSAGALQGTNREDDLRDLFLESTRVSAMIASAGILFLAIMGDILLRLWMGARYSETPVLPILALGSLLPLCQRPASQILIGMNLHGRVAIATCICVAAALVFTWEAPARFGIAGAAFVLALPLAVCDGIVVPVLACRKLGVPVRAYLERVLLPPFGAAIPFAALLFLSRRYFVHGAYGSGAAVLAAAGGVLVTLDWQFVLTAAQRQWIRHRVSTLRIAGISR